ncbi:hypothetical protein, partial [Plasticicumulans sp.]|uniref:hypothetical protein n=1 Tax=Plasticicumulans sp. TaxID=2307179 RepID=UPI00322051C2
MSESSGQDFVYPGSTRGSAKLRRVLIAGVLSVLLSISLSGLLLLAATSVPEFAVAWSKWAPKFQFIPEDARTLPLGFDAVCIVAVLIFIAIGVGGGKRIPAALDFFLFPGYDDKLLVRIERRTGTFKWHLPDQGPVREMWDSLSAWLGNTGFDGCWHWQWVSGGPELESPFEWRILCGENGIGKTQLALELARAFGQRQTFGDGVPAVRRPGRIRLLKRRMACTLRRWLPFARTQHDPWDSGLLIAHDRFSLDHHLEELACWLPRRPTLLILDDPRIGAGGRVIQALEAAKHRFWYPVRLLIVDQFITPDLPLVYAYDHWRRTDNEQPFMPSLLHRQAVDDGRFHAMLAAGFWRPGQEAVETEATGVEIKALWASQHVRQLVGAVEGSPMLLALAVLWLAANERRSVHELLRLDTLEAAEQALFADVGKPELLELVRYRLLRDRVQDLYRDLKAQDRDAGGDALRKSIAAACIGDGVSLAFVRDRFQLSMEASDYARTFVLAPRDGVPSVQPWIIAEGLVLRIFQDVFQDERADILAFIGAVFEHKPESVIKRMSRPGRVARWIADAIHALEIPGLCNAPLVVQSVAPSQPPMRKVLV